LVPSRAFSGMPYHYDIYGLCLESDVCFPELVPVRPRVRAGGGIRVRLARLAPSKRSAPTAVIRGLQYRFDLRGRFAEIDSSQVGTFRVWFRKRLIEWDDSGPCVSRGIGRLILRGRVLAMLLAHRETPLLIHADVVAGPRGGVAFSGPIGAGKSTLAASFLAAGWALVSDDVAVADCRQRQVWVRPGAPEIRLWPSSLRFFASRGMRARSSALCPATVKKRLLLDRDAPWIFRGEAVRLSAVYDLARGSSRCVKIWKLGRRDALLVLLKNQYMPFFRNSAVMCRHFEMAASAAVRVPIKRLEYPAQWSFLDDVRNAVNDDLRKMDGAEAGI